MDLHHVELEMADKLKDTVPTAGWGHKTINPNIGWVPSDPLDYKDGKYTPRSHPVERPNHYQFGTFPDNVEVKDIIKEVLGDEGYRSYCVGNVIKYVLRHHKKNGTEDLKKAKQYLEWIT